jgi:chromosome partitioning protein
LRQGEGWPFPNRPRAWLFDSKFVKWARTEGGFGKSTLAVHLAAWLLELGHSVTLADCDTQHSSSDWAKEAVTGVQAVRRADPDEILDRLSALGRQCDFVVADGPGSNIETSRALLLRAGLALMPCKAGILEARALVQATNVLRQAVGKTRALSRSGESCRRRCHRRAERRPRFMYPPGVLPPCVS